MIKKWHQIPIFSYWYDIQQIMSKGGKLPLRAIHQDGGRQSGKTDSATLFIGETGNCLYRQDTFDPVSCEFIFIRNSKDNMYESMKECDNVFQHNPDIEYEMVKSEKVIRFKTGNQIRFYFTDTHNRITGLSISNADYIFIVYEEAYEII